jgi:hypothetical protein
MIHYRPGAGGAKNINPTATSALLKINHLHIMDPKLMA